MKMRTEGDWRQITNGLEIPTQSYSDQPYIIITDDGAWLCCVTTGPEEEGASGQHITTMRSTDQGSTWSEPVPVEATETPENSYAVMLKTPSGRVYTFYNHNSDNVRKVKCHDGQNEFKRVDSLGHFVFKYSDDHGRSWSKKRYDVPFRLFKCDLENIYGGKLCFFWNVGKPFVHDRSAFVSLHKVGQMGAGFFQQSEGALLKSDNILVETDPDKIRWETLPDGEIGLRTPPGGGPISEEQSYVVLSDGSFLANYRSIDGYPVESYSRDNGHSWSIPKYKRYPDGRMMKNPRAANFIWKCQNGKYLYWFHNHGGRFIREMWGQPSQSNGLVIRGGCPYDDRNPVWLCGGVEGDSPEGRIIRWSEPEIVLYDDDPFVRISYPDLIEDDGSYFLSETQKDQARVHEIDQDLLKGLWAQPGAVLAKKGIILELPEKKTPMPAQCTMPKLPIFNERDFNSKDYRSRNLRQGFTVDIWIRLDSLESGQVILDSRTDYGQGLCLQTVEDGGIEIVLNDGRTENRWSCEPGMIEKEKLHHVTVIIDGGPKIISFIIDGKFCDGGDFRQFGWGRFSPNLMNTNGLDSLRIGLSLNGNVKQLKIYDRYLRTSEVIGNFKSARHKQ